MAKTRALYDVWTTSKQTDQRMIHADDYLVICHYSTDILIVPDNSLWYNYYLFEFRITIHDIAQKFI